MAQPCDVQVSFIDLNNPELRELYIGVDNDIRIIPSDTNREWLLLAGDQQMILYHDHKWSWSARVSKKDITTSLLLGEALPNGDTIYCDTIDCVSRRVTDPVIKYGNVLTGYAPDNTPELFYAVEALEVVLPNCNFDAHFRVYSYNMIVTDDCSRKAWYFVVSGNQIPKKARKCIRRVRHGGFVMLWDIKATCPDCSMRTLPEVKYEIAAETWCNNFREKRSFWKWKREYLHDIRELYHEGRIDKQRYMELRWPKKEK